MGIEAFPDDQAASQNMAPLSRLSPLPFLNPVLFPPPFIFSSLIEMEDIFSSPFYRGYSFFFLICRASCSDFSNELPGIPSPLEFFVLPTFSREVIIPSSFSPCS